MYQGPDPAEWGFSICRVERASRPVAAVAAAVRRAGSGGSTPVAASRSAMSQHSSVDSGTFMYEMMRGSMRCHRLSTFAGYRRELDHGALAVEDICRV